MTITDFIKTLDRGLVESAHICFKMLMPLSYGGKWFFYCEEGDTVEDLCKWVEEKRINVDIEWPYNDVSIFVDGKDTFGKPIYKYEFDLNDYPEREESK